MEEIRTVKPSKNTIENEKYPVSISKCYGTEYLVMITKQNHQIR